MKVAVSGKGGTGKTTIAATLARCLARRGHRVLAIDGDSNPNLAMSLGINPAVADAMRPMPARATIEDHSAASTLIDEYAIAGPDGVRLVLAAKVDQAGGG
jgi:CO dehydrogenase maturation factor